MLSLYHVDLQHIDNLAREKAFFKGPPPLLLSSLSPDDLTFLLLGSVPKTSQVEFGALVCPFLDGSHNVLQREPTGMPVLPLSCPYTTELLTSER